MNQEKYDVLLAGDPPKRLTDWKNEPSLHELKRDLHDAKPAHDAQVAKIQEWLDNYHVTGKAAVTTPKGSSRVQPKLIRKQAEWRYPNLTEPFLSTADLFQVEPVTWEDKEAAVQNGLVLNHQFNTQIDRVAFIDEYVRTLVEEGTAIVKVGWETQEEEVEEIVPLIKLTPNPAMTPILQELDQLKEINPTQYNHEIPEELKQAHAAWQAEGVPYEGEVVGEERRMVTRTVVNRPTLEVCDFRNVIIDPTCQGDLSRAGFIIYSFESSLSALKADGRYKNLERINLHTNSPLSDPDHASEESNHNFNFSDDARKKFVVYEYWGYRDLDGSGRVKPFVAAWVGDTLIRMEENPFPDKALPFVKVQYLPRRKQIYGEPDGVLLEDNQKIIGAVTRGMIDLLGKSANAQMGIRKDMLDATNRRRFQQGLDYEFNAHVDPQQGVYMHKFPEIPASAQFMLQLMNIEAESLTGVKAFASQGLTGEALGATATGIRGALDAASKRELSILRRLAKGIVEIGRKILAMNAVFLSEEEVIRITNDKFVTVRRDDLGGRFDLRVDISTAEADNAKAQDLAFMLQTMGSHMDPGFSRMILAEIARLKKMPDLAQRILNYQPQPDPLVQRRAELEIALMEAQLATEQAKAQELATQAQKNLSQANTEQAKAGKLVSDTDQANLDFVEQESGVKHAREMEKHGAQARAQMQLKLLERSFDLQDQLTEHTREYLQNRDK